MVLTGRVILTRGKDQSPSLSPASKKFAEFVENLIYEDHGFTKETLDPVVQEQIQKFVTTFKHSTNHLYRRTFDFKIKRLLESNWSSLLDNEIRFVPVPPVPPSPPQPSSPEPSGNFLNKSLKLFKLHISVSKG